MNNLFFPRVILVGSFLLSGMLLSGHGTAFARCPKVLMFDGVNIRTQTNPQQARYWGEAVGVQGFFINNLMGKWQADVGPSPESSKWKIAKKFQDLYSRFGVTDNFVKVAIYKPHDWRDPAANSAVVRNFRHAAAMARYAGFKGIALDLEPYVPMWGGSVGGSELANRIKEEGKAIGAAMKKAYPNMTLVIIRDALYWAHLHKGYHGGYGLAVPFLKGMFSAGFKNVVIAEERTYKDLDIAQVVPQTRLEYKRFFKRNNLPKETKISIAPGLWPLGLSKTNKSARQTPRVFGKSLRESFRTSPNYIWIYGYGSAWQTGGYYAASRVVGNFNDYVKVVHTVKEQCNTNHK